MSIDKLREFAHSIMGYYHSSGTEVYVTAKNIYVNKDEFENKGDKTVVGFTKTNMPIAAWLKDGVVKLWDITKDRAIDFSCSGSKIMDFEGRIYVQNGMNIIEIFLTEIKDKIIASPHIVANVLEQATRFFDGVVIQNLFDAYYVSLFPMTKNCQQIALRELDGLRVHRLSSQKIKQFTQ